MKILAHVDPVVLESELLSRVDAVHARKGLGHTLILVPTTRLSDHVQRRLARVRQSWLGLRVLSFGSLGREVLSQAGATLRSAPPLLLESLLTRLLRQRRDNRWSTFIRRRPGAAASVLSTIRELREACIDPADLEACADTARTRDLAELYRLYDEAMIKHTAAGWTDDAGLARAARPHAARFGETISSVFVHGAYELIGVYLDLLRELDTTSDVTVLTPVAVGSRVTAYAERFSSTFLPNATPEAPAESADEARAARLVALYDESSEPQKAPEGMLRLRHAQGSAAEVKFAVRRALRSVSQGCPPPEIAIVARTLEPYTAALEESLDDAGLPWTSSLETRLRRQPIVRDFLLLLGVVAGGFPRDATVELLQSPTIRWKALGCPGPPPAAPADRWSRDAGIIDGLADWTEQLEAWTEPSGRQISEALQRIDARIPRDDARWSEHASSLVSVLDELFGRENDPAAEKLHALLESMGDLERLVGDQRAIPFDEAREWLERAVDATTLALAGADAGGIRVLDAPQLRGLTFRQIHVIGMNGGLFPRVPREDPVLSDDVRRALRDRTRRPLGVRSEATEEEHLLLAMVLGSARDNVDVSWQRADESGRAKIASLALREIARWALGRPDIEYLRERALHLPSHPTHWLDALVEHTGMLAADEQRLLATLHGRAVDAAESLGRRFPELLPGLEMLRSTQSFTPVANAYDGRVGPFVASKPLSVSDIETLGSCPLRFFFGSLLRVRPLQDRASAFKLARQELGSRIHDLLESTYTRLRDEGLFAGAQVDRLVQRGLELLDQREHEVFGEIGNRVALRVPRLWEIESRRWLAAVRRFAESDLRRLGEAGLEPTSFEELITETLEFGEGCTAVVRGKFDRLFEGNGRRVVGDYKTSNYLSERVSPTLMLKGQALQVPLYRLMVGPDAEVELLGVHPDVDTAEEGHLHVFAGFADDPAEQSFRETMRVLLGLNTSGIYPFRDSSRCSWCEYTRACRRNHPPSRDREKLLSDAAGYRKLQDKSARKPHGV